MIKATCVSSDGLQMVAFDAEGWFKVVSAEEIHDLARSEWCEQDVALYLEDDFDDLESFFVYIDGLDDSNFECHVDPDSAIKWLEKHRPEVADIIIRENLLLKQ